MSLEDLNTNFVIVTGKTREIHKTKRPKKQNRENKNNTTS